MSGLFLTLPSSVNGVTIVVTIGTSGNSSGFVSGSFGSISPSTYVDHSGVSRTISQLQAADNGAPPWALVIRMNGTPPDSDATFISILVNGTTYLRSAAASLDVGGGVRQWAWGGLGGNPIGTSGTTPVVIS
jgi:hypothetical protein